MRKLFARGGAHRLCCFTAMQGDHLGDGGSRGAYQALGALFARSCLFDDFCGDETPAIVIVIPLRKIAARFVQSEPHCRDQSRFELVDHSGSPLRK
jgi:hypothetical protein